MDIVRNFRMFTACLKYTSKPSIESTTTKLWSKMRGMLWIAPAVAKKNEESVVSGKEKTEVGVV